MKQRLDYLDVAKGILILMVVLGHFNNMASSLNIHNTVFEFIDYGDIIWAPFFMPAFFVITGYCSSFSKAWNFFTIAQIKTLLLPAFSLGLISTWIGYILNPMAEVSNTFGVWPIIRATITSGSCYWFLTALFICKMALYVLVNTCKTKHIIIISIICYATGVIWHNVAIDFNPWYLKHALLLLPFMAMGYLLKEVSNLKRLYAFGGGIFNNIDSGVCIIRYNSQY